MQAGVRLRGRGEWWGYLAIHRFAVVARWQCELVAQRRYVTIGYGQCSSYAQSIIGNRLSGENRRGVRGK